MASNAAPNMPTETYSLAYPNISNPPNMYISHGLPYIEACVKHVVETFDAKRAYILASTTLYQKTSRISDLEEALGLRHTRTWTGIPSHTPWDDIVPVINDMRERKADLLITVGGCSLTDAAKAIIYFLANNVTTVTDIDDLLTLTSTDAAKKGTFIRDKTAAGNLPSLPLLVLPTTLSASEYTAFAAGTSPITHAKTIIHHPALYPRIVLLAPELSLTTPPRTWFSTGVRALDHAVEAFCHPTCPPQMQDAAMEAIKLLIPNLLLSQTDPSNLTARLACHLAAKSSAMSLTFWPAHMLVGASHGIGHQLGPLGVAHGETSCILMPAVAKFNKPTNGAQQARLARLIWDECGDVTRSLLVDAELDGETGSDDLGDMLDVVFRALGMPRRLSDVGVVLDEEKMDVLVRNSLKDPACVANPTKLGDREVREIMRMVV